MKADFHFHFYSRIVGIIAILVLAIFALQRSVTTEAFQNSEITGWAWAPTTGWISLNCNNDFDGDGELENTCATSNYGLSVVDNHVKGCVWSGQSVINTPLIPANSVDNNLGWICFSDVPSLNTAAPTEGIQIFDNGWVLSTNNGQYASVYKLEEFNNKPAVGNTHWQIGFSTGDGGAIKYPITGCFNCYLDNIYACSETGNTCTDDGDCNIGESCIVVGQDKNCHSCLEYTYYSGRCSDNHETFCTDDDECSGTCELISTCNDNDAICRYGAGDYGTDYTCNDGEDACTQRTYGSLQRVVAGYECSNCTIEDLNNSCYTSAYNNNLNRCDHCKFGYLEPPGLFLDNRNDTLEVDEAANLCGFAFNKEIGWIHFSPRVTNVSHPYISVEEGSIYAKSRIYSKYSPPFGKYNASYLIESGGTITNFLSGSISLPNIYQGELSHRPLIDFFSFGNNSKYTNALGSIDYLGLITEVSEGDNKYGGEIVEITGLNTTEISNNLTTALNSPIKDKVFYHEGGDNVTIGLSGPQTIELGAGVVVIDGDLFINNNIVYNTSGTINNLKDIPSIVWIVKGDVIINPTVTEIVGTFVVLGDGISDCSIIPATPSCGRLVSGVGNNQLIVSGSVLARQFELGRTYFTNREPAEVFVSNGRLQANPPLGLIDFSKVVPRFSEKPY